MEPGTGDSQFAVLFERCPDAVFITSEDGVLLNVNAAACALHRCRKPDLIGRPVLELVPEEDREVVRERLAGCGEGTLSSVKVRSLTLDGRVVPVEAHSAKIEYGGRMEVLLIVRDVSKYAKALADAEAAKVFAEDLIRRARLMEVALDGEGRIRIFNEMAAALTGRVAKTVLGEDWVERFVPELRARAVRGMIARVREEGGEVEMECPVLTVKGTEKIMALRFRAIVHPTMDRMVLISGADLTAYKREESYRTDLERQMVGVQKLEGLGRMAGAVAHDFNNFLTAILGNAALVRSALPAASEHVEPLKHIEKTALHAADLCKQLLAYSGRGPMRQGALDLGVAVEEVRALLEVSAGRGIALEIVREEGRAVVSADITQVRQVLLNLMINAAEAIRVKGGDGGRIRVRIGRRQLTRRELEMHPWSASLPAGAYVGLSVEDNGCGIPARSLERVVEPFFSTKRTGRGLGLAAVLSIVRSHDGVLRVESEEGAGATFTVYLPERDAGEEAAAAPAVGGDRHSFSGKALFVDDEESLRVLGAKLLESFGCEVVTARDGVEAVEVFRARRGEIGLVIMDLSMPRMGGKEAWEAIRKMDREVPVLLVSGYSGAALGDMDERTGFLAKPFRGMDLRERIGELISGRHAGGMG